MGSRAGVLQVAAMRVGLSLDDYQTHIVAGEKWCTCCKDWHPRASFGADRSRTDGFASKCQLTRYTRRTKDRPGVRERRSRRATGQAWCRGCRAWLLVDEVSEGACRAHHNSEARAWYAARGLAHRPGRTRARLVGLEPIPGWWAADCLAGFGGLCAYGCTRQATTWDHIWPVARGGCSRPTNLVPACRPCNSSKKDRHPSPWVDRGCLAFPGRWEALIGLALWHSDDEWLEAA